MTDTNAGNRNVATLKMNDGDNSVTQHAEKKTIKQTEAIKRIIGREILRRNSIKFASEGLDIVQN